MHKSWGSYPICFRTLFVFNCYLIYFKLVFEPDDMSRGKTNLFVLVLCAIIESVEGLIYLLESFSLWELVISILEVSFIWYLSQSCVDLGFDIIWTILLHVTLWCAFLVFFVFFSKSCLLLVLEGLDMHIYFMYKLWHVYFLWSNISGKLHRILNRLRCAWNSISYPYAHIHVEFVLCIVVS